MHLSGKSALVTGSGRGIGRATALALAGEGCNIIVAARTGKEISETAALVEKAGSKAVAVKADVSNASDVKRLVAASLGAFKAIDILVNNAGVALYKPVAATSEAEWNAIIATNLTGVFLCTTAALPHMLKQRAGIIINISSGAGKSGYANMAAYCASKFGVIGFTESLAGELPSGIRVYAVCPGGVDTKMYRDMFGHQPALKPAYIAEKVLELCLPGCRVRSGSSVEAYGK